LKGSKISQELQIKAFFPPLQADSPRRCHWAEAQKTQIQNFVQRTPPKRLSNIMRNKSRRHGPTASKRWTWAPRRRSLWCSWLGHLEAGPAGWLHFMFGQGLGGHCKIMTALNFSHLQKNYGKAAKAITVMCGSTKRWPRQCQPPA
jgi:hypothetical protein